MQRKAIWEAIELEIRKAKKQHPNWPNHPAAQAGIVVEEAGELMRAALQWKYQRAGEELVQEVQKDRMRDEAIQVACVAIRFLENLK